MTYEDLVKQFPNKDMRIVAMLKIDDDTTLLATHHNIFTISNYNEVRPLSFEYKE